MAFELCSTSLSYVQHAIIHEEVKNKDQEKSPVSREANEGQQSALFGRQRRGFRCYGCGEAGHFRRDCPKGKETTKSRKPHTAKPVTEESNSDSESDDSPGAFVATTNPHETTRWLHCHKT